VLRKNQAQGRLLMIRIYDSGYRGECPSEMVEQINSMGWLEKNHSDRWPLVFHYPAETKAKPQYMAIRRKLGVKSGIADIIDFGAVRGAFELKRRDKTKSKVSKDQIEFLEAVDASGGFAAICYSHEQFLLAYSDYLAIVNSTSAR
jgi:hypothetical protein